MILDLDIDLGFCYPSSVLRRWAMIVILVHLKIQLESMNVTSFLIISYLSNSEYWSQRRSQSVSIHSIYCICLVST